MTLEQRADEVLSAFSWASKSDGDPFQVVLQALREARAEGMELAAKIVDKHPALKPCPWCSTNAAAIREAAGEESTDGP